MQPFYLFAAPATNIFLFLRLSVYTFFTCTTIYFKNFPPPPFPPPPPYSPPKKKIQIVRPLEAREKEDHVVRGFMSLTQLLSVLCGRLHISTTANLATQESGRSGEVAGRGRAGEGCKMTSFVSVLLGSTVLH